MKAIKVWTVTVALAIVLTGCVSSANTSRSVNKESALDGRLKLATEYLRSGNHQGARDHLKRALDIDPNSAEAHDLMALLYVKEIEPEVAEKHYKKAIKSQPDYARVRNNYGSFLYSKERYQEAYDQLSRGADDLDYERRFEIFGKMGLCALKLEQRELARKNFEKAIALNQRWSAPYLELASIAYEDGKYAVAQRYLDLFEQKARATARSLWLGIRLAEVSGKLNDRDSKEMALKNLFPDSVENQEYQDWLSNERRTSTQQKADKE